MQDKRPNWQQKFCKVTEYETPPPPPKQKEDKL